MSDTNIDDVLEIIGFGFTQLLILCTCGCICVCVMNEMMGITIMAVSIACEFGLSDMGRSFLTNAGFLGMIVFGHYSGYATDLIGRRQMALFSTGLGLTTSIASLAMPNFYLFLLLRFLVGSILTGASVSYLSYLIEYTEIKMRPRMVTYLSYFLAFGYIYVPSIANFFGTMKYILFSIGNFDIRLWRLNMLVSLTPGLFGFIGMLTLPESAKYFLSVGKNEMAYNILNKLCKRNRGRDLSSFGVTSVTQPNLRTEMDENRKCFLIEVWLQPIPLFKPPYRRSILTIMIVMSGIYFVGNGLGSWFMQLRQRMPDVRETVCEMLDDNLFDQDNGNSTGTECWDIPVDYIDGILFGCCILCIYIIISLALMCVTRKLIMLSLLTLAITCGILLNFLNQKWFILCAFIGLITTCHCCISLSWSILCDVVPTHLRGTALSILITIARVHVVVASQVIGAFITNYCLIIFNIFLAATIVCFITTIFLPK